MRVSILLCVIVACWSTEFSLAFSQLSRAWGLKPRSALPATATATPTAVGAVELVKHYTQTAIEKVGTEEGLQALEELGFLCSERQPYDFDKTEVPMEGSVLSAQRQVLPPNTTAAFLRQVQLMEENGWMSTNPDSVDGLPSLHLNLISHGKPLFDPNDKDVDDFGRGIQKLVEIVQPHINNQLLPSVHQLMNSTDIVISDVFLRRYGEDIAGGVTRQGISAHYDVYAKATAVIALDNVAAEGENGLYTTATYEGETSNHASLRRYFPLKSGDGVVHTWDVLHGVDVQPGLDRTSLIVWFSTKEAMKDSEDPRSETPIFPWLSNHPSRSSNDVVQFVLASALECASKPVDSIDASQVMSMHHGSPTGRANIRHQELYLQSAKKMNSFALTRLGSFCQDDTLSSHLVERTMLIASSFDEPPAAVAPLLMETDSDHQRLARRFWLEGALRGNALAQIALGDEAMELAVASGNAELRVVAATLFGLAAQQGMETATDSLSRVIDYEASTCQSQEEFMTSPVLRVANAAI